MSLGYCNNPSYRSFQFGFDSSINRNFHKRFHFLICFSRVIADSGIVMNFKVDQMMNTIRFCKSIYYVIFMLIYTSYQIIRDTNIQSSISL